MGGGGGGNTQTSTSSNVIPPELRELYQNTADSMVDYQNDFPLSDFGGASPLQVADANPYQIGAASRVAQLWGPTSQQRAANDLYADARGRAGGNMGQADRYMRQVNDMRTSGVPGAGALSSGIDYGQQIGHKLMGVGRQADQLLHSGVPRAGKVASGNQYLQQVSGRRVQSSADDISNDAALNASREAFRRTVIPEVDNSTSTAGLLRSGERDKIVADAWAKNATPHITNAIQRDENRLDRMVNAQGQVVDNDLALSNLQNQRQWQALDAKQRAIAGAASNQYQGTGQELQLANLQNQRQWQAMDALRGGLGAQNQALDQYLGVGDRFANLGGQQWNQMSGAIDKGMNVGGAMNDILNNQYQATYDDFLRRQGLAEKAQYAPFGQVGNMVGSTTTTRGGGK